MERPEYAHQVFKNHFERAQPSPKFVSLELGPGDSLFSALTSWGFGGVGAYLVDMGNYAINDVSPYRKMEKFLERQGLRVPDIQDAQSLGDVLTRCNARYLNCGVSSLREIPDQCIDFVWSQAVLEHIRKADFLEVMCQLRRVLKNDGICSHKVDLKDHLGGALNNLRFPEHVWEAEWMATSGFYTNRIRFSEMIALFKQAEFKIGNVETRQWDHLPTPRSKLSNAFRELPEDELRISGFSIVLNPRSC